MADNVTLNSGTGGDTVAADDIGGVKFQRVKITTGADGTANDVSNANPVPVSDAGGSLTVDGTVAATQSGTWSARIQDGAGNALTSKAPGAERALSVAIVDGSGNQVTSFGGTGGTAMTDDAAFTPGTTPITPVGALFNDVTPDSVNEGDGGALRMSANRNLYSTIRDAAGNERGVNVNASNQLSVSVDNTVAVASHAVTNAGTFAVQVSSAIPAGTNNIGDVDVLTLPALPAGTNNIGDVDVLSLPALPAGTNNIGDVDVLTLPALPAGTNNIGDVDVLSMIPGTAATNLGKAEDAAHASGDTGVAALAVRRDTAAVGSGTDGDYSTLNVDATGRLYTTAEISALSPGSAAANLGKAVDAVAGASDVGIAGLYVRDDALSTLTPADGDYTHGRVDSQGAQWVRVINGIDGIADDAAFTPGTTVVLPIGFQADETAPDSVNEGDIGAPRMSLDRKPYVIAHHETSTIYQNGTARTPAMAAIDAATSGDNTLLAAQGSGNKIRVHQLFLVAAGTVNVRFESGAGGTALTGQMNLVANTGFVLPYSPIGWFETAANTLLNLELSGAVSVDGNFAYTVVT